MSQINVGDRVRSFDFESDRSREVGGPHACYVEGRVVGFKRVESCSRYHIKVCSTQDQPHHLPRKGKLKMTRNQAYQLDKDWGFYVDRAYQLGESCLETEVGSIGWGVFGLQSGFCYALLGDETEANRISREKNRRIGLM